MTLEVGLFLNDSNKNKLLFFFYILSNVFLEREKLKKIREGEIYQGKEEEVKEVFEMFEGRN